MIFFEEKGGSGCFTMMHEGYGFKEFQFEIELEEKTITSRDGMIIERRTQQIESQWGNGQIQYIKYAWNEDSVEVVYIITTYDNTPSATVRMDVKNTGKDSIIIKYLRPVVVESKGVVLGNGIEDWSIYKNGIRNRQLGVHKFASPDFSVDDLKEPNNEDTRFVAYDDTEDLTIVNSGYLSVLRSCSTEHSMLLGYETGQNELGLIRFCCTKDERNFIFLEAVCIMDDLLVKQGESVMSESLLIDFRETFTAIDEYALRSADKAEVKLNEKVPTGWCSWYFFYESVTEQDVISNLEFIHKNNMPVEYIQIDMGWEQRLGDWYANYEFPNGMKWMADQIHAKGYKAGIWLCPFWVELRSWVHREHPEWLLKNKKGDLIIFHCHIDGYVIDTTIPEARKWITETFHRISQEWGYDYVKIDFLRAISMYPDVKYANAATRAQALRMGLEAVREGVGPETLIMSCGGHFGPALGIAGAARTSGDVDAYWESVKTMYKWNILRYWMNGRWWYNDPDCVMLRGPEEGVPGSIAAYKQVERGTFTDTEVKTILTLLRATGGMVFLGDDMPQLKKEKIEMLKYILPATGVAAIPRDMFEQKYPHILDAQLQKDCHEVSIINWNDEVQKEKLLLRNIIGQKSASAKFRIYDKWDEREVGEFTIDKVVDIGDIEPHGCKVLLINEVESNG